MKNGRRLVLTIIMISVLLIGPTLGVVHAAYLPYAQVTHTQSFDRAENNHTYVRVDGSPSEWYMNKFLTQEEDVDYDYYDYGRTGWDQSSNSYDGPATREFSWYSGYSANWGWTGESVSMPRFYDFTTLNDDTEIGAAQFYRVFPLIVNQEDTLLMESGYLYIGTFNVTDEEFFYLTVTSHQDALEMEWVVYDYQFRAITEWGLDDGDIETTPFATYGNGTYYIVFEFYSSDPAPVPIDILLEPVVPEVINLGDIVEDTLPGSEVRFDEGTYYYEEMRPAIHTYKFSLNSTQYGCLSYGMNMPSMMGFTYYPKVTISNGLFIDSTEDYAWGYYPMIPSDSFYYRSFANESYYITIQGMDYTDFYIINQLVDIPDIPINEEFFIQNWESSLYRYPYKLNLGHDSVLRINRTEWSSGFNFEIWTVKDNGLWDSMSLSEGGTFETASSMFIPAGEYLIIATSQSTSASGLYEFNLGPVIEGVGNVNVANGRLVGLRVPVENMMFYRSNITLLNHENLSVLVDVDFMNEAGLVEYATLASIGNQQSGTSWIAIPSGVNTTSWELGLYTTSYSQFCDGNLIIVIAPSAMANNTGGGSIPYFQRTADFEITFEEDAEGIITTEDSLTVGDNLVWNNFTLDEEGDSNELYVLRLDVPAGVWMNVSTWGSDIDDMEVYLYQNVDGCPIYTPYTDLTDTLVGTLYTEGSFQFGSVSDEVMLVFDVDRDLLGEGSLNVSIQTFMTNEFEWIPIPSYYSFGGTPGPVEPGIDPALAIGAVAVVGIIVVVVVVIVLKKKGTI